MNKLLCFIFLIMIPLFSGCTGATKINDINVAEVYCPDELAPVYCVLGKKIFEDNGIFDCKLRNNSNKEQIVNVSSEVVDFSSSDGKTVTLQPGETKTVSLFPVFNDKILELTEQRRSSVRFKVQKSNETIFEDNKEITILATDDMIWGVDSDFDTSFLIASWVTPRDPVIGKILARAKEKMPDRTLCGYQREDKKELLRELEAIWDTLQELGISYVSSGVSFGGTGITQRVKLPRESIEEKSANCADGSVLMASIFENLEMEPVIVITTDHVFVGVRDESESDKVYYIETTMLGDSTFKEALTAGNDNFKELKNQKEGTDYIIIDITSEREQGITPIPVKGEGPELEE